MTNAGENIYARLGARPVINAGGNTTVWGGSTPSPEVARAMEEAGGSFVEMEELLAGAGARIAELLDVEAAYPTAGCYAALVLSTAACLSGEDAEKADRLPDTTGMKDEIVLPKPHQYSFDRAYTIPGSKLVLAGDDDACSAEELEAAIGPNTAAVAYLINNNDYGPTVSLEDALSIAHARGLPVIGDAASQIYPIDYFRRTAQSADLVCFGGKYVGAPQSTGFVCGRKDLIDAVTMHGFVSGRPFGRGMKMDRQEIIGMVVGVEAWVQADHEERIIEYGSRFAVIEEALEGVVGVQRAGAVATDRHYGLDFQVSLDTAALGKDAQAVADELLKGTPRIRVGTLDNDILTFTMNTVQPGEEQIIADRLSELLG